MSDQPLTAAEIEERLDVVLDAEMTSRRTTALAQALAPLTRAQQEFVLRWADVVAKTNTEVAHLFVARAPQALGLMPPAAVEEWLIRAMDVYDRQGMYPACSVLNRAETFAQEAAVSARGAELAEVAQRLELFVQGLSGRKLALVAGDDTYTDTETLFLPARLAILPARDDNLRLYKVLAAHLWAQTFYGTFRHWPDAPPLVEQLARYDDPARATAVFHALETLRLDACLARDLPGLARDMRELQLLAGEIRYPSAWEFARAKLARPEATVRDSLALTAELYDGELPPVRCYQGKLLAERAEQMLQERLTREKQLLRNALARQLEDKDRHQPPPADAPANERFKLRPLDSAEHEGHFEYELLLDGQPVAPSADVRALMDSVIQDLGNIPEDYLSAAGAGGYSPAAEKRGDESWVSDYQLEGAHLYNEWDHRRQHYRKDWCVLREVSVPAADAPFARQTLIKYAGVLPGLRKTFEALRGEDRLLRRQPNGDDIDLDALVEAHADMRQGREAAEQLFIRRHKVERNIAVMFMVDMSGSTRGWINDAERESLVLLCEALEVLGDRYAIYGFSGMTRQRCELYPVKRFDEAYSDEVRARIGGIAPKDYTRMGVTVRHLTKLLMEVEARTRLLITLSDGKPDDFDGYRGEYGIEDTRMSLIEAKRAGIHPFCITIDETARDYLPHLYGAVNWVLVDDVKKLPLKVSDIYRRLTL